MSYDIAVGVGEFADVLVGVGGAEVTGVGGHIENAQGHVQAEFHWLPGVAAERGIVVQGVQLLDQFVAVVDEPGGLRQYPAVAGFLIDVFLDPAAQVVVAERQPGVAFDGFDQPVFAVPHLRPAVAGQHVAVRVTGRILRDAAVSQLNVLVEVVRRIRPRRTGQIRGGTIADRIVIAGV